MSQKNRLAKLEKIDRQRNPPRICFDVQTVEEITEAMRQEQREAHARGEQYYIVEESDDEY